MTRLVRPRHLLPSAAVLAAAAAGGVATDPTSRWYRGLDKPPWQPPPPVFGWVWTPLYIVIAVAGTRAVDRHDASRQRRRYFLAYGGNLVLNAGWNWIFFRAKQPRWAVAEILLLEASTLDLIRRTWQLDRAAGRALVPYAVWVAFAAALTVELARRNPAA